MQDFNIGVNNKGIERWSKMLPKIKNDVQSIIFSKDEHAYYRLCKGHASYYAVRWFTGEVLFKALSWFSNIDLRSVEVSRGADGRRFFNMLGRAQNTQDFAFSLVCSR